MPKRIVTRYAFYRAVKTGNVVKFRDCLLDGNTEDIRDLPSPEGQSLLLDIVVIAASEGRDNILNELVDFGNTHNEGKYFIPELPKIFIENLYHACRSSHESTVTCMLQHTKRIMKNFNAGIKKSLRTFMSCDTHKILETVDLHIFKAIERMWKFDLAWYKRALVYASKNGNAGLFEHIVKKSKLNITQACKMDFCRPFFHAIAIGQGFEQRYYEGNFWEGDTKFASGSSHELPTLDEYRPLTSAFGIAARFGRLRMVKHLYNECQFLISDSRTWCLISREIYREAIRFGHRKVVDFIIQKRKIDESCKLDHASHLEEQYDRIPAPMYQFMIENYIETIRKSQKSSTKAAQKIAADLTEEALRKVRSKDLSSARVIVDQFSDHLGANGLNPIFAEAVKVRFVDLVYHMLDKVDLQCPYSSLGHQCLELALSPLCKRSQNYPDPIITEMLLKKIEFYGSACLCGEVVPMDFYLNFEFASHARGEEKHIDFYSCQKHAYLILRLLALQGFVPRVASVKKMLKQFFSKCETLNFIATRVLSLANWLDLLDVYELEIMGTGRWFDFPRHDLTNFCISFLTSLCGSKIRVLRWNGFIEWVSRGEDRMKLFMNLVSEIGLTIQDKAHIYVSPQVKAKEAYNYVRANINKPDVLSLMSLARLKIYQCARAKSTASFREGTYEPLFYVIGEIVDTYCPHLAVYMNFDDIYYECT